MRAAQTFVNKPFETEISPTAVLSHWGQRVHVKYLSCQRHGLSNILNLNATFLYSIYHQRAGKTNLFHMRGGRFHAGNTLCTSKYAQQMRVYGEEPEWVIRTPFRFTVGHVINFDLHV